MHYCHVCKISYTNPRCPRCGAAWVRENAEPQVSPIVSDPDTRLDTMVSEASRPTLASLVRRGLRSGLIQPMQDYATRKAGK